MVSSHITGVIQCKIASATRVPMGGWTDGTVDFLFFLLFITFLLLVSIFFDLLVKCFGFLTNFRVDSRVVICFVV